ncbi:MAG: hypothetical protein PHO64_12705 [Thiomonas sp.]|nr:hypothetical protein [Thiomonas sp.]MDE1978379.1 hypothetical protein [Betaproteobacteria bacterium]MDE2175675.1 hypothetical protein [Betaproteobacteria bacterium]MDE2270095.1 hypothetical protein [Betaproteobacteria bacterium]CQR42948.1 membrane hypothetical protein [Thiomonas sp. CB3]
MNPDELLRTAAMLGLFLTLAGGYALFWGAGRLHSNRLLAALGYACYGGQWAIAVTLWLTTSLGLPWKLLLAASAAVCSLIPWVSLHYVRELDESMEG